MITSCPLCGSANINIVTTLATADLVHLWNITAGIDTASQFGKCEKLHLQHCSACDFRFFDPLITGSEDFYKRLQEKPWYFADEKYEFGQAAALVGATERVLEIGAGKGVFPTRLTTKNYLGLEFSTQAIAMAKERGIELRQQTIEDHARVNAGVYDVVCSFQVVEHVSSPRSFLEAATACLKPGGRLMISVPAEDSYLHSAVNAYMNLPPHHVSRWSDACLERLAPRLGLSLDRLMVEPLADEHAGWYLHTLLLRLVFPHAPMVRVLPTFWYIFKLFDAMAMRLAPRLAKNLRPRGHTVLATYRKNEPQMNADGRG